MDFTHEIGWFLPRVTTHDGRAIELALAEPSLFDPGLRLEGAVVEATFASKDPPLLKRLRDARTPFLVDPQTIRFVTETYLSIGGIADLPYAPAEPISPDALSDASRRELARGVLLFQQSVGSSAYVPPAVPLTNEDGQRELNLQFLRDAADMNGSAVDRRPILAMIVPGRAALAQPAHFVNPLADIPLEAIYVQPVRCHPVRDSVENLVRYTEFLLAVAALGVPVVAGRVGSFGLVLQALGIQFFDSGLGDAESFDLGQLNRPRSARTSAKRGGGRNRRVYFEALKTTLTDKHARSILDDPGLRSRFVCNLACCRFKGFEGLADRRREHYLHVRMAEVSRLRAESTASLRTHRVHDQLREARDHAAVVRRVLGEHGIDAPSFAHLDRWIGCLARVAGVTTAA